jgi:FemAB-related protein (PEP-CTERM system-associated)
VTWRTEEWAEPSGAWDDFVRMAADGTVMHLRSWKSVLSEAYGHPTFLLAAADSGTLRGVLPLALVRSPFLGRSLVSMPFMDYGGVCGGQANGTAERMLLEAATALAGRTRAKLVLRYLRDPGLPLPRSLDKVTMWLDLGQDEGQLWRRLPPERRNRIRKAQRSQLDVTFPGPEGLDDFYSVYAQNMHALGSPAHSRRFFAAVLRHLAESTRLVLVRDGNRPVGANLMLVHGGMISMPWVSWIRAATAKCPNQLLYWETMRFGLRNGCRVLDLGRSSRQSGSFEAKRQWGARPVQLHWHYHPKTAIPGSELSRVAWAARLWRRLPFRVATRVGPWLRRGIAN